MRIDMRWMIDYSKLTSVEQNVLQSISRDLIGVIYIKRNEFSNAILFLSIRDFHQHYPEVVISYVSESYLKIGNLKEYCDNNGIRNIFFYNHREIIQLIDSKNAFSAVFFDDAEDLPVTLILKLISNSSKLVLCANGFSQFVNHPVWNEHPASIFEIQQFEFIQIVELNNYWKIKGSVFELIQRGLSKNHEFVQKDSSDFVNTHVRIYNLKNHLEEVKSSWEKAIQNRLTRDHERVGIILPNNKLLLIFVNTLLNLQNKPTFSESNWNNDPFVLNEHLRLNSIDAEMLFYKSVENLQNDESNKIVFSTYSEYRNFDFDYVLLPFLGFDRQFDVNVINYNLLFLNVLLSCQNISYLNAYYSGVLNSEISNVFEGCKIQINSNDEKNSDINF